MVPSLVDLESLDHFCATTSGEVSFHSDLQLTEVLPPQSPTLHRSHRDTRVPVIGPPPFQPISLLAHCHK
uniref:Uncharacterized protein n=2 Tax=Arabidopsis thaliana TaxID=3702 RepID=Q1G306_ARATH|nr:unknown protein [Arabidopsis thaliana]